MPADCIYAKAEVEGAVPDTVASYFGMRKVEIGPGCGPLDQGGWPDGLHTPPPMKR